MISSMFGGRLIGGCRLCPIPPSHKHFRLSPLSPTRRQRFKLTHLFSMNFRGIGGGMPIMVNQKLHLHGPVFKQHAESALVFAAQARPLNCSVSCALPSAY